MTTRYLHCNGYYADKKTYNKLLPAIKLNLEKLNSAAFSATA